MFSCLEMQNTYKTNGFCISKTAFSPKTWKYQVSISFISFFEAPRHKTWQKQWFFQSQDADSTVELKTVSMVVVIKFECASCSCRLIESSSQSVQKHSHGRCKERQRSIRKENDAEPCEEDTAAPQTEHSANVSKIATRALRPFPHWFLNRTVGNSSCNMNRDINNNIIININHIHIKRLIVTESSASISI